ncbi:MAG: polyphosphate polymerase domain-containing protein [Verrucomicrobia bacterium]|nr:polyphosphate polymerase domain-containing protein [Verrucomicrobiota bacterium]
MNTDRLQTQRFELKFQVPEATAVAIRHFVRPYLAPDEFAAGRTIPAYPVHSLYLDSGDLHTYRATVNGDRDRYKLRVRYYDESPDSPIYLEIKRRVDRCIYKQRARVRREFVPEILGGAWPSMRHLIKADARDFAALQKFCELLRRLGARPRARVSYDREAWTSEGNNAVRVTMDRVVVCEPELEPRLDTTFRHPVRPFGEQVIVELKFTNRYPDWLQIMVRTFNLVQGSAAKYVDGVNALGASRFSAAAGASSFRQSAPRLLPVLVAALGTV